jgi:hypothetical protein
MIYCGKTEFGLISPMLLHWRFMCDYCVINHVYVMLYA